jgi:CBS domain-containing protein
MKVLTVRDVMRSSPLTLQQNDSLRVAVDMLVGSETGGAAVVTGDQPVGVISLSDVLAFEAVAALVGYGQASTRPHGLADVHQPIDPAAFDGLDGLVELDGASTPFGYFRSPEWEALDHHSVEEVMTRKVLAVHPDTPIQEAAELMDRGGVHRLVVTDRGAVVGLLGARDIVRAVAQGNLIPTLEEGGAGIP